MINFGRLMTQKSVPFHNSMINSVAQAQKSPLLRHFLGRKLEIEKTKSEMEMDYFLKSPKMSKAHNMDPRDTDGWEMYNGLMDKINITNKALRLIKWGL